MFDSLKERFENIFSSLRGKGKLSEEDINLALREVRRALLEADVNYKVVKDVVEAIRARATGREVLDSITPSQLIFTIVYEELIKIMGDAPAPLVISPKPPTVYMMVGLQGSGKTTAAHKLAYRLKKSGRNVMLVAADLVRPAAITQLQVLGEKVDVPVFTIPGEKNPVKVAEAAVSKARHDLIDTVIIDTSGRMHLDEALMNEIQSVAKAVRPDETLFVADAMTGQSAVEIAKEFEEKVGISGVILTKFDSDTRGGAALSLRSVVGKPIKFIGTGEKMEDLEPFHADRIASRILGMGDVVSLVEKAQEQFDQKQAEKLAKKIEKNTFDLQDYLEQIENMTKMGTADKLIEMIPGAKGNVSEEDLKLDEFKKQASIIRSMTKFEKENYRIIGPSRRKRIAKGSGTSVADVNKLLKQFEKSRLMMKKVMTNKKLQAAFMKQFGM